MVLIVNQRGVRVCVCPLLTFELNAFVWYIIVYERHIAVNQGTDRSLHNEGLHHLCSSKKIFRIIKEKKIDGRDVVQTGERRGTWRVSVGKPEGKKPLGKSRRRWEVGW